MSQRGEGNVTFWDFIKNVDANPHKACIFNYQLIQELQKFIQIYELNNNKPYLALFGFLKEDKLFNFLCSSHILDVVSATKIKETCDALLQYIVSVIEIARIYG